MKTLFTQPALTLTLALTLTTTLMSGAAFAETNNVQLLQLGSGTIIELGSHYDSQELVSIDRANLTAGQPDSALYLGSK